MGGWEERNELNPVGEGLPFLVGRAVGEINIRYRSPLVYNAKMAIPNQIPTFCA
jgi:hypothetical protein